MKKMEIQKMEMIEGGSQASVTGLMCGFGIALLLSTAAAPLAVSPLVGCATGLLSMWSTGSWA